MMYSHQKHLEAMLLFSPSASIEDKLQSVERQYLKNLQTENQKWSSQTEKRLLGLHKQWEHDKKKLLEEEVYITCLPMICLVQFFL